MGWHRDLRIILSIVSLSLSIILLSALYIYFRRRWAFRRKNSSDDSAESGDFELAKPEVEDLLVFPGCEHLRTRDILDAPGEVVGKSSYGTLYRATIRISAGGGTAAVMLLRFVHPACVGRSGDVLTVVRLIGLLSHPNLVPLRALYVGSRGEKLFVYPYYAAGNLAQFLKGGIAETSNWKVIREISLGIARGLEHLHNALPRPIIHGNLKSKNVLLTADLQPRLSDFSLHLLLSPPASQEMLETSAMEGYKAPELIKMKEAGKETDIYSLGIVFLELITRRDAPSCRLLAIDGRVRDAFGYNAKNGGDNRRLGGEAVFRLYQLGISCCSSLPALRPDIKHVVRELEEIGL